MRRRSYIRVARWLLSVAWLAPITSCGKVVRIGERTEVSDDSSSSATATAMRMAEAGNGTGIPQATVEPTQSRGTPDSGMAPADSLADASAVILPPAESADADVSPNVSCDNVVDATPNWSFDASLEGWQYAGGQAASLSWSSDEGASAPGAVLLDGTTVVSADVFVFVPTEAQDLSGTLLTARVLVEAEAEVSVKLFAQSGTNYAWADGGVVVVAPGEWACLALDLDEPAFAVNAFDVSRARRLGMEVTGSRYRLYLDDVSY